MPTKSASAAVASYWPFLFVLSVQKDTYISLSINFNLKMADGVILHFSGIFPDDLLVFPNTKTRLQGNLS